MRSLCKTGVQVGAQLVGRAAHKVGIYEQAAYSALRAVRNLPHLCRAYTQPCVQKISHFTAVTTHLVHILHRTNNNNNILYIEGAF